MSIVRRTSEETRQCILVAAWDLFRQIGFRKTTIADIAGALGMSSANIYRFFASKDALTEAICEKRVHEVVAVAMEENWGAIQEFIDTCDALVGGLVAEGQAAGEFGPGDPVLLGKRTMEACAGVLHPILIAKCAGDGVDVDALARDIVAFALRALANKNPPLAPLSLE
jgi:AcrR family transcriptional regulator